MAELQTEKNLEELQKIISSWLERRLDGNAVEWVTDKSKRLKNGADDWEFFTSFSAVPRYTGKDKLDLSDDEQKQAKSARKGWQPQYWSVDELARTFMELSIGNRPAKEFLDLLDKTFTTADIGESVALYKSFAILPYPEKLRKRAAEGLRTNINSVFNAVSLHNPYPADYLDEGAWNQMVLKALFVGTPLYPMEGLDRRANKTLARMLVDYAHERWAASRTVSPELWRPVGPFAEGDFVKDLEKVLNNDDELRQQAGVLALSASSSSEARELLDSHQDLVQSVDESGITWDEIGRKFEERGE